MALNAPFESDKANGGVLHWLEPDSSFYEGNATFQNVISNPNSTSDWVVQMNGWTFSSGGKSISNAGQTFETAVDPFYNNIYIPQDEAQLICKFQPTMVETALNILLFCRCFYSRFQCSIAVCVVSTLYCSLQYKDVLCDCIW